MIRLTIEEIKNLPNPTFSKTKVQELFKYYFPKKCKGRISKVEISKLADDFIEVITSMYNKNSAIADIPKIKEQYKFFFNHGIDFGEPIFFMLDKLEELAERFDADMKRYRQEFKEMEASL